ncbi:MAG: TetR family transcriptional regulator C-terminal domain-containing protein [Acinetobacter populi]|uniref:TetR family transcriptional regulator C-terminal domain-containing protein n=1 Tax=Acinetobacter populi TaxID=1582270 RepID=UPI002352BFE1|nr:TetR family transcriptional regulator C-terminal domain-containing protein [Acinetobacter populi]MCH4248164.1 TetR family transcriptional regulator C-terminal domain-containing protein [Acinetobacter populi]
MTVTIKKQTIAKSSISKKQQLIIQAALKVFSLYGLTGASMEQIAQEADMSKSNLFYYFDSKDELYTAVLSHVLTEWLAPLNDIQLEQEPAQALSHYIDVKYQLSKKMPEASKLYALEIIQGAPHLTKILKGPLKALVKEKVAVIDAWIAAGKMKPISALHLIFHIWAVTQHYSDFAAQIEAVSGKSLSNKVFAQDAKATTLQLLVESLVIKEETVA